MPSLNKPSDIDWIIVGRFGRVHGTKGFVTVHSFTQPRDNILQYEDWHAKIHNHWQPVEIVQVEANNKSIIALIKGYEQRELAVQLTNSDIAIDRTALPKPESEEYYWHDIIGMEVIDKEGILFGTVVDLMSTGANDVLVVEGEKRHLIPYLPQEVILEVNTEQRVITVAWDVDF